MKRARALATTIFFSCTSALGVHICNKSDKQLFVRPYYCKKDAQQAGEVTAIAAGASLDLTPPEYKLFHERHLYFSPDEKDLKPTLSDRRKSQDIPLFGSEGWTINLEEDQLIAHADKKWEMLKPTKEKLFAALETLNEFIVNQIYNHFAAHDYADLRAQVRPSTTICDSERTCLQLRSVVTHQALEKLLNQKVDATKMPGIAIACSGGGYRAMISALGALGAAQATGLLDATSYVAGLSGSTWSLAVWNELASPIGAVEHFLSLHIQDNLFQGQLDITKITAQLLKRLVFKQQVSLIDLYGLLLAEKLLKGTTESDPFELDLYHQSSLLEKGSWPIPVYTSCIAKDNQPYQWMEYTPYEIGSDYLQAYVPSWGFGRAFRQGVSVNKAKPESLAFLLGIWGSAFSANFKEIYQYAQDKIKIPELKAMIEKLVSTSTVGDIRLTHATVCNFTYRAATQTAVTNDKFLTLVDAGLDFNLPIPPLLKKERGVDIIIAIDASDSPEALELKKAQAYAYKKGLPFPVITTPDPAATCTVYQDPNNPQAPVIVYLPLVKNSRYQKDFDPRNCIDFSYCATSNFAYTPEQITQLSGLMDYNFKENLATIQQVIKDVMKRKSS